LQQPRNRRAVLLDGPVNPLKLCLALVLCHDRDWFSDDKRYNNWCGTLDISESPSAGPAPV
jgi:hypothetical protein